MGVKNALNLKNKCVKTKRLGKIFGAKYNEVNNRESNTRNCYLYRSSSTVKMVKSRRLMGLACSRDGQTRNAYKVWCRNLLENREEPGTTVLRCSL
jgi:hypothetical protein